MEESYSCTTCKELLAASSFGRRTPNGNGKRPVQYNCKSCQNVVMARWRKENPEKHAVQADKNKLRTKLKKYGLTQPELDAMMEAQQGLCAICKVAAAAVIDHCHNSGKVRALLCNNCNVMIGMSGDDPEKLRRAIEYLAKHQ